MIGDVSRAEHIYIVCGYTDMRKSIDWIGYSKFLQSDVYI
ncbi:MAG: transposase [Ruminococcus sp.]|nr:transposase [Ruminococcus sp.]